MDIPNKHISHLSEYMKVSVDKLSWIGHTVVIKAVLRSSQDSYSQYAYHFSTLLNLYPFCMCITYNHNITCHPEENCFAINCWFLSRFLLLVVS